MDRPMPSSEGGLLRSSDPWQEGHWAPGTTASPALVGDAGQLDGQTAGQRVLRRLGAALDTLPGRTAGWE